MKPLINLIPLLVIAASVISAAAVGQSKISQLENMHEVAVNKLEKQDEQLQASREEIARQSERLKSVDERTRRIESKLDQLLDRR